MRFKSYYPSLKILHSKGTAEFKKGIYETNDKDIIEELKKDKNIFVIKSVSRDDTKQVNKN